MNRHPLARNEGMALLIATVFMSLALVILGTLTVRTINQSRQTDRYTSYENCMYGIESALAQSQAALENGQNGMVGVDVGIVGEGAAEPPCFDSDGVTPQHLASMTNVDYITYVRDWDSDGLDNNGDGAVDEVAEKWYFNQYASARDHGTIRQAETVLKGSDINVWRNAIFAGTGQAGGLVNGNVSIHGAVHLLGDSLLPGNEAITAIDLSGTSLIHNNYNGIPAALAARVPPLPTKTFNGETVSTLNATLRVKRGYVGTSGNSEVGEPDIPGNGIKETMDGTYVTDGWTGTAVVDDGGRNDPEHVYSDNGWDVRYNLGDRVQLPLLTSDWRDPDTGARQYDAARASNYTHEHYFDEVLVGDPNNKTDGIYSGDIVIQANTNFYYNASRPSDPNPLHRLATDDYIYFNSTTNIMEINGQISINGNLTVTRGGGNDKTIYYRGRAAILVHGAVTLDTDLLTINADGTTANSFPQNNCLGVMASGDMTVGSLSQLQLMGAFYAQGKVISSKQTTTMGSFVASYFDMGTNVPHIYQVPSLADYLPIGMVGAYPILYFDRVSWRELG